MSPEGQLEELLIQHFTDHELRRLLRQHYAKAKIEQEIPSSPVAPAVMVHELVGTLSRRKLINGDLFKALREARPQLAEAISTVERAFLVSDEASPPETAPPGGRPGEDEAPSGASPSPTLPQLDWRRVTLPGPPARIIEVSGVPLPVSEFARVMHEKKYQGASGSVALEFPVTGDSCVKLFSKLSSRYLSVGAFSSRKSDLLLSLDRSGFRPLLTTEVPHVAPCLVGFDTGMFNKAGLIAVELEEIATGSPHAGPRRVRRIGVMRPGRGVRGEVWTLESVDFQAPMSGLLHVVRQEEARPTPP